MRRQDWLAGWQARKFVTGIYLVRALLKFCTCFHSFLGKNIKSFLSAVLCKYFAL